MEVKFSVDMVPDVKYWDETMGEGELHGYNGSCK